jgi:hypothetical protein
MKGLQDKNILYIGPKFFNYENKIKQELENFGASVDYFDDRPSNDFFTKVFIRLKLKFMVNKKIHNYYQMIYRFITNKRYDYVFVVSPETLSYKELQIIKKIQPTAKYFLYMWDSFNNKNSFSTIKLFDKIYSFDDRDVEKYNFSFLPLFYISEYEQLESERYDYDLTFIATAHSDRYKIAKKISTKLTHYRIYFYFYLPSKIMFYVRKFFIKKYQYGKLKEFSFKPLEHSEIVQLFKKSKVILDINHPNQYGLTMRTFECLGAKKKLITTNQNIKNYDFYNQNNIMIIERNDVHIDEIFFNSPYENVDESIFEKYSIREWINTMFINGEK